MLRTLTIRDFVIVDTIELEFSNGFTVFTGETGAGKSILIDALQLALGGRGDASMVREGAAKADISVNFDMQTFTSLQHGDQIMISRSPNTITFLHPEGWSYYHTLREKLHWNEYPSADGKLR